MLAPAIVFLVILAMIIGPYWIFVVQGEEQEERALKKRLKVRQPLKVGGFLKAKKRLSAVGPLDAVLSRSEHVVDPIRRMLEQAGMQTTVGTIILASVFAFAVTFALVFNLQPSLLLAVGLAAAASSLPLLFVRYKAKKRLETFEEQFPEAVDLMARALRAGHALTTALQMASEEIPSPVGTELKLVFEQQNYGMPLQDALRAFGARVRLLDARIFVTALLTQRETGGNLSEVLDNIASVIRERFKVKRQVRVMSAHGRITGWVLGLLPPALAVILFIISPQHILMLRDDPLGVEITVAGLALQIVGVLIIRRIVDVEY